MLMLGIFQHIEISFSSKSYKLNHTKEIIKFKLSIEFPFKMIDPTEFEEIDEKLLELGKLIKPLYYITPINSGELKEDFLKGKITEPKFKYKHLEYYPRNAEDDLKKIVTPETEMGEFYKRKILETLLENALIEHRDDKNLVRGATIMMHGWPDKHLIDDAINVLEELPEQVEEKNVNASQIKKAMESAIKEFGFSGWKVEYDEKRLATIYNPEKKITVCETRKFSEKDIGRIRLHEIGVHMARAFNGFQQDYKILGLGIHDYLSTEEGLTSYFESVTGNTNNETMRDYAGRVLAVDGIIKNLTFSDTFKGLKIFHFSDDQAWNLTVRAHRGGGYVKDHVYLQGYFEIKEFMAEGGDPSELYIGKIGIKHLPLFRKLRKEGIIGEPKVIPTFIKPAYE